MNAPLPEDEAARLDVLRQCEILDTPPESDFDDIVRLAAQICDTPVSLVSLVDKNRQWFKSRHGTDMTETPRRLSFCAHAILKAPEATIVADATRDERFADNELVTGEPRIRFYASVPLVTPEGHALGTLCVMDYLPRELTAMQMETLRLMGRQVAVQLELRRRLGELARTSGELKEANTELEGFAHAISHDLRGPLRTTISMVEILLARYGARLDQEAVDLLKRVEHSGQRMAEMLEDFLRLMRVKAQPLEQSQIDMQELAAMAISDLRAQTAGSPARIHIAALPLAQGDRGLICQVWTNLISNALKFSRKREAPLIEIGAREEPGRVVYFVKDNGAGFDAKDAARLWTAFRRLHGREFEGTGLGLSIVQRIVRRHGGEVWAEGAPDRGATFYFALPRPKPLK